MLREGPALRRIFEMHVLAEIAAAPGDHADFGRDPVDFRQERTRALRHIADVTGLRPPARPAFAIHRPQKWIDAPDAALAQARHKVCDFLAAWRLVQPVPAHPERIVTLVEKGGLPPGGMGASGEDDRGEDAKSINYSAHSISPERRWGARDTPRENRPGGAKGLLSCCG